MAAKAFDDAFRDFKAGEAMAANTILLANVALQASEDARREAIESHAFLANLAKSRFRKSPETAKSTFQTL